MEIVEISGTYLHGGILDKLDLPAPRYHSQTHRRGQFVTDVTFYPSKEHCDTRLHRTIDVVSQKAIHYMEDNERKVLQDYNYIEIKRSEDANLQLTDLLAEKDEMIKGLAMTTCNYIGDVFSISDQISSLAVSKSLPAGTALAVELARKISEVERAVARLSKLSHDALQLLKVAFGYPEEQNDGDSDGHILGL
ncbi:hypothetical protein VPH35_044339 [Triticum aestivum]